MRIRILPAIAAVAALSLTACSVVEQFPDDLFKSRSNVINVKFTTTEVETKTAFGEFKEETSSYPTFWTANDQTIAMSLNFAAPVEAVVIKDAEVSNKADFSANFQDTGSPYLFYAFSPNSAVNAISESRSSWAVTIPTVQTPKADGLSCDEAAMLLYAKSEEMTALPANPVSLHFSHVTSYCRLALKNLSTAFESVNASDATVKSVYLTYSVPVAGDWYVNAENRTLVEKEASYTITLKPVISDLSQPTDIWFALAPCTLDGETLTVSVNTDKGSLSRTVTFGSRTYVAGAVNKVSIDMSKNSEYDPYTYTVEETVYELVTSLSNLNNNDVVVFADAKTPSYAMTATTNSNNGIKAVAKDASTGFSYSAEDGFIRLPEGSTVAEYTVNNKDGSSLSFKTSNTYLQKDKFNQLTLDNSPLAFTVSISNGSASLSYSSRQKSYYIYYSDNLFNLTTTSNTVAIFKKTTATTTYGEDDLNDDPVLEHEQYGAYLVSGSTTHTPHVTQLSREYAGNELTFAILFPANNTVLEFNGIPSSAGKGDEFTLNVKKVEIAKSTNLGDFSVTVIKEEGAKLWLTDKNGNGFIVKR